MKSDDSVIVAHILVKESNVSVMKGTHSELLSGTVGEVDTGYRCKSDDDAMDGYTLC